LVLATKSSFCLLVCVLCPHALSSQSDYKAMPELDRYDTSDIDDAEYAPINPRERQKVEAALRERDRLNEPITRGLPAAFVQTNDGMCEKKKLPKHVGDA